METKELEDIQALITIFFPFAEELITKFGEFHPFAGATTIQGEFVSVGQHQSNNLKDHIQVIKDLKSSLRQGKQDYLVVAIFYEVRTKDSETGETEDAIAVYVEHKDGSDAYEFFYPYKLKDQENFHVDNTYGNRITREIFL